MTEDLKAWADAECPGVDLMRETAKFRDHTFKAAMADWPATWRNWMRKACEYSQPGKTLQGRVPSKYAGASAAIWEDEVSGA